MTNSEQALREFAEKQHPENWELAAQSLFNQIQRSSQAKCLSDLTVLISEHYVSREKYDELLQQRDELKEDIEYLARRQQKAGSVSFTAERETGVSSNSIVSIAYGIVKLEDQSFPSDWSDLNACRNMWKKLPEHRKTGDALIAMERAEAAIKNTER